MDRTFRLIRNWYVPIVITVTGGMIAWYIVNDRAQSEDINTHKVKIEALDNYVTDINEHLTHVEGDVNDNSQVIEVLRVKIDNIEKNTEQIVIDVNELKKIRYGNITDRAGYNGVYAVEP